MLLEVHGAKNWPLVCILCMLINLFSRFILNILVISNMINLSDDAGHEHLLGEEINKKAANHDEELMKTAQVSQESEDVRNLALIGIIELVGSNVDCNEIPLAFDIVILIGFNI